jgi:hypothetical protein
MLARTDETEATFLQSQEHEIAQALANFKSAQSHAVLTLAKYLTDRDAIAPFANRKEIDGMMSISNSAMWIASTLNEFK